MAKAIRFLVLLIFPFFVFSVFNLKGQERDAGLWTSVNAEVKLVKKLSFAISEEFRFNNNITELGTALTDAGFGYKYKKHWQFAVGYRYSQKRKNYDYYSYRHRYYVDIKYSRKIKPFELSFRTRFQDQVSDIGRAADGGIPEYYLRNKLGLQWNLHKDYSPYLSAELFSPLKYPRTIVFDGIRVAAGIEYDITKHHKIDLGYMVQKEVNVSRPVTDFVITLGYFYKI